MQHSECISLYVRKNDVKFESYFQYHPILTNVYFSLEI